MNVSSVLPSRPQSAESPANFGRPADFDSPIQPGASNDSIISHGSSHDAAAALLGAPGPLRGYKKDKVPIGGVRRGAGEDKRPVLPGNSMFNRPASASGTQPTPRSRRRSLSAPRSRRPSGRSRLQRRRPCQGRCTRSSSTRWRETVDPQGVHTHTYRRVAVTPPTDPTHPSAACHTRRRTSSTGAWPSPLVALLVSMRVII